MGGNDTCVILYNVLGREHAALSCSPLHSVIKQISPLLSCKTEYIKLLGNVRSRSIGKRKKQQVLVGR